MIAPRPTRILLVASDCGPGDVLRLSGCLAAVRDGYPDAEIVLLVDEVAAPVVERSRLVTRVVVNRLYNTRAGAPRLRGRLRKARELARLVAALGGGYDLVLIFYWGTTLLNVLGRLLGRRRIGYANRLPRLLSCRLGRYDPCGDPMAQNRALFRAARLRPPPPVAPSPIHTAADEVAVRRLRAEHGVADARALVVMHPGSDWACQQWLPERWGALADRLALKYDAVIVFTGLAQEEAYIAGIQAWMRVPSVSLAGCTTLPQLGALLAQARLCVCVDSVAYELAQAAGTPAVVLAGPTRPEETTSGPRPPLIVNRAAPALRAAIVHCKESKAGYCLDYSCPMAGLRDIEVHDVLADIEAHDALTRTLPAHPAVRQGDVAMLPAEAVPHQARAPRRGPRVTIVIPTRNRATLIGETLEALLALDYAGLTILVVDQSTDGATADAVRAVAAGDSRVRLLVTGTVGSSAARNLGARASDAEVIAYTDDDCIVSLGWLDALLAEFADPGIAAVYGRLLPHNSIRRTGREVGYKPSLRREEYARRTPPWYIGHGGNMAFRRADLLAIGGFDPLLGAGGLFGAGEDSDIAYRLLATGRRIVYSPDALAYHKHWKDWTAQRAMERAYGIGAGAQFAKYARCADVYGLRLLGVWVWQLGMRRTGAGLLKWHSTKTMYLGYCQLVYPWVGIWRSLRHRIDRRTTTYRDVNAGSE